MAARGAKRKQTKNEPRQMRAEWLHEFSSWLERVPGDESRAFCKICVKEFNAERTQLVRHKVNILKNLFDLI